MGIVISGAPGLTSSHCRSSTTFNGRILLSVHNQFSSLGWQPAFALLLMSWEGSWPPIRDSTLTPASQTSLQAQGLVKLMAQHLYFRDR